MKIKPASLMAFAAFSGIILMLLDIIAYTYDENYTITYQMQDYLGGSAEMIRTAIVFFLFGVIVNHFAEWGKRQHKTIKKPWGKYIDFYRDDATVFKEIHVDPGERLSLQYHALRGEFWHVVSGEGVLQLEGKERPIKSGDSTIILKHHIHNVRNEGTETLIIREMQYGFCNEEDIVRLEDKYDR
jgi:mannose-6-phosphate isomerase